MNLEESIRKFIAEEVSRQPVNDLQPVLEFCRSKNISRVTIWRAEKQKKIKITRIGRKVFVPLSQFVSGGNLH